MFRNSIILSVFLSLFIPTVSSYGDFQKISAQVTSEKIALERPWLNLLHYNQKLFSRYHSRADDPSFFLSDKGLRDPEAELLDNLKAFLAEPTADTEKHAICRFPARFKWVKKRLKLNDTEFPKVKCPGYDEYVQKIRAKSVSLVFVSANINEAASMFGHTFIRFHRNSTTDEEERDHTLSFVARVDSANFFSYIYKGMFAGFHGKLDFVLMRQRIITYNISENRNMWELSLDFSQEEVDRVVDHSWEFRNSSFDYFFIDENCAFYNLALLEAARPELNAYRDFLYPVVPSDTIRGILHDEKILTRARFFPANLMEYKENYFKLNSAERKIVAKLSESATFELPEGENLNRPLIVSTAIARVLLRTDKVTEGLTPEDEKILHHLEDIQKQHGFAKVSHAAADYTNPSIGHHTTMASGNFGNSSNGNFLDLTFRTFFHELTDSPLGYFPFSEIQVLTLEARYALDLKRLDVERTELVKIVSLKPMEAGYYSGSWMIQLGSRAVREMETRDSIAPHTFFGKGAYGVAYQPRFIPGNFLLFSLAQATIEGSTGYEKGYRISPGLTGGIVWNMTDRVTTVISGFYDYILLGEFKPNAYAQAAFNVLAFDSLALEVKGSYHFQMQYYETRVGLKVYF